MLRDDETAASCNPFASGTKCFSSIRRTAAAGSMAVPASNAICVRDAPQQQLTSAGPAAKSASVLARQGQGPCGGIGRRGRLKICCPHGRAGSIPARGTTDQPPTSGRLASTDFKLLSAYRGTPKSVLRRDRRRTSVSAESVEGACKLPCCLRWAKGSCIRH
jgi:hypothetical protein